MKNGNPCSGATHPFHPSNGALPLATTAIFSANSNITCDHLQWQRSYYARSVGADDGEPEIHLKEICRATCRIPAVRRESRRRTRFH